MRERDVQGKVVGYARARGVIARKLDFGQGWPDFMFLHEGHILFAEFKGAGGRLQPLQGHVHALLRRAGFEVVLVDTVIGGCSVIDAFLGTSVVDYSDITKELCK